MSTVHNQHTPGGDHDLASRFKRSVVSYGIRQFAVILLTFGYNIALTHYLTPSEFGKVAVTLIVVNVSVLLADGGFGVYLIQRREEISERDLSRVMTIQLTASTLLAVLGFAISGASSLFYPDQQIGWMIACASLSLPFVVVRGMSLLILERTVRINRVVRVEVLEEVVYAAVAIGLASEGAGAWSVVAAQMSKAIVGCGTAMLIGRYRFHLVKVEWDDDLIRGFRFGFHYQAAQLINMARVSIIPLYIVPVLGFQAGGFVERSLYFCSAPLSIILAVQKRTMFPYIARIQQDLARVRAFTEQSIYISAVIDKLMFLPLLVFARDVILIMFGQQWLPMLPLIYWVLAGNITFGALAGTLYPVANGLGKSEFVSGLNLLSFVFSWVLMVPLTLFFDISGVGIAAFIMWFGIHYMKVLMRRYIGEFDYYRQIVRPLASFLIAAIFGSACLRYLDIKIASLPELIIWSLVIDLFYVVTMLIVDRQRLLSILKSVISSKESAIAAD